LVLLLKILDYDDNNDDNYADNERVS